MFIALANLNSNPFFNGDGQPWLLMGNLFSFGTQTQTQNYIASYKFPRNFACNNGEIQVQRNSIFYPL
jgi:hypothetical protein